MNNHSRRRGPTAISLTKHKNINASIRAVSEYWRGYTTIAMRQLTAFFQI